MRHINIFVAGSKKLMNYREKLVLWANDKNYAYRRRNEDLQINVYSFKEVGDDQDVYNEVITKKSDIIVFLIEKNLGARTKEELEQAKAGFRKRNRPQMWVFTNRADNTTRTYLEGSLGRRYGIDFSSPEELVNGANKRLEDYLKEMEKSPESRKKIALRFLKRWGVFTLVLLSVLLVGWRVGKFYFDKKIVEDAKPKLIIAGGGSVANFIEERPGSNLDNLEKYEEGYYLHLPTKVAWELLKEEVVSKQGNRRYYPVCISATEAADSDFSSKNIRPDVFKKRSIVVACKLGEDSLAVYIQKDCSFLKDHPKCCLDGRISVDLLKKLIIGKTMNVYATSPESGTKAGYCHVLKMNEKELDKYVNGMFSESASVGTVKKPFLLLGSQYYQMKMVSENVVKLIVDANFAKPMMIYFMAKNVSDGWEPQYEIPKVILNFLERLDYKDLDEYISSGRIFLPENTDSTRVIFTKEDLVKP